MAKTVVFTTHIEVGKASEFDKIAERAKRSRAGHLEYLIDKEIIEKSAEAESQ